MACSTNVTYLSYELNEDNFPRIIRSAISQPISVERFEMLLKSSSLNLLVTAGDSGRAVVALWLFYY